MNAVTAAPERGRLPRPRHEVAEILRRFGPEYRETHLLSAHHRRVMRDIEQCRTAALGGHVDECEHCGQLEISYNSCRNRHCPKCQGQAQARWVANRQKALLPIEYFHVVFTVPELLHPLFRAHRRLVLTLLFRAVSETLLEFGKRHLHGEIGITAVLHTWGQTLCEHPHLHCLVTGGALSRDGSRFRRCSRGYLFPVRALSQVFRGKYCAYLEAAYRRGELPGLPGFAMLTCPEGFARYLRDLRKKTWIVYAKRPFAGPEQVLAYLGRYTHRVAISNHRLVSVADGQITFRWKDYRDGERQKVMTVTGTEFLRRFLVHVLPPEFVRIRHYGLLANGRTAKLARCRELLGEQGDGPEVERNGTPEAEREWWEEPKRCEQCGIGRMRRRFELPPVLPEPGELETRGGSGRSSIAAGDAHRGFCPTSRCSRHAFRCSHEMAGEARVRRPTNVRGGRRAAEL